ncbi:MAG: chemotaxis protein CheD [Phycisphaerae bacterium]|nr:chemotaxis protein CheD [Phycisphaerae bacterium]
MCQTIDVNTGEVVAVKGDAHLRSQTIGSCIVIAAFDKEKTNSGMAHIMLAGAAPANYKHKNKYALDAIEQMLVQMIQLGSAVKDITVSLVGAGNVLRKSDDNICQSNIDSVRAILNEKKIKINASVLGGFLRKSIFLDAKTGTINYTQGDSEKIQLWPA